ncbi:MAG TPA: GspH/FimT family pseudopilin [Longimicrobium sp.]|jgi:prepilin-type N-terminal cleavage/methylation domain-containing protein|uniref:pilus assembly FimT family protein n=1 Tax=Longimicrobium sp. TaxID=2029185 RepID=UPI002ED9A589
MQGMDAGFSLLELVVTVGLAGVLCAFAVPRMDRELARMQVRAAANRVAGDLAHARGVAIREGAGAVLVLEPAAECAPRFRGRRGGYQYRVGARGQAAERMRRVNLRAAGGRVCAEVNGADSVEFTSRGLPRGFHNRTFWVWQGAVADTLTLSAVGRVLRVR